MKQWQAGLLLAAGALWTAIAGAALRGPVRVEGGLLAGTPADAASITAFKGIPYAAPPVGPLRWRPPQAVVPWRGVRAADHFGAICPQPAGNGAGGLGQVDGLAMSEDCLFLNVWTGADSANERRPVMVWFHGAGPNQAGSLPLYGGANLAKLGVVVVTVDYRIGALGGLATAELSRESGHGASGNYMLLDDIAALKWVQKNIAAFGGDPRRVTLFGQSYGAATEHRLSMSPLAKGLFQRMILQSHARYPRDPVIMQVATSYQLLPDAEAAGARYMDKLGVHSLAELRALPWQQLVGVTGGEGSQLVDGYVVPRNFSASYAAGTQNDVQVMAGVNSDETGALSDASFASVVARAAAAGNRGGGGGAGVGGSLAQTVTRQSDLPPFAERNFGPLASAYLELYPADSDAAAFKVHNETVRDNARVSLWMWAGAWRAKATQPVYLYYWTHAPPGAGHDTRGAYHGSEIAYAFDNASPPGEPWSGDDQRIADVMSAYWTNYARTGDPNGAGLPRWAAYDAHAEQVMELGDEFQPIALAEPAKVDFWRQFYATQPEH